MPRLLRPLQPSPFHTLSIVRQETNEKSVENNEENEEREDVYEPLFDMSNEVLDTEYVMPRISEFVDRNVNFAHTDKLLSLLKANEQIQALKEDKDGLSMSSGQSRYTYWKLYNRKSISPEQTDFEQQISAFPYGLYGENMEAQLFLAETTAAVTAVANDHLGKSLEATEQIFTTQQKYEEGDEARRLKSLKEKEENAKRMKQYEKLIKDTYPDDPEAAKKLADYFNSLDVEDEAPQAPKRKMVRINEPWLIHPKKHLLDIKNAEDIHFTLTAKRTYEEATEGSKLYEKAVVDKLKFRDTQFNSDLVSAHVKGESERLKELNSAPFDIVFSRSSTLVDSLTQSVVPTAVNGFIRRRVDEVRISEFEKNSKKHLTYDKAFSRARYNIHEVDARGLLDNSVRHAAMKRLYDFTFNLSRNQRSARKEQRNLNNYRFMKSLIEHEDKHPLSDLDMEPDHEVVVPPVKAGSKQSSSSVVDMKELKKVMKGEEEPEALEITLRTDPVTGEPVARTENEDLGDYKPPSDDELNAIEESSELPSYAHLSDYEALQRAYEEDDAQEEENRDLESHFEEEEDQEEDDKEDANNASFAFGRSVQEMAERRVSVPDATKSRNIARLHADNPFNYHHKQTRYLLEDEHLDGKYEKDLIEDLKNKPLSEIYKSRPWLVIDPIVQTIRDMDKFNPGEVATPFGKEQVSVMYEVALRGKPFSEIQQFYASFKDAGNREDLLDKLQLILPQVSREKMGYMLDRLVKAVVNEPEQPDMLQAKKYSGTLRSVIALADKMNASSQSGLYTVADVVSKPRPKIEAVMYSVDQIVKRRVDARSLQHVAELGKILNESDYESEWDYLYEVLKPIHDKSKEVVDAEKNRKSYQPRIYSGISRASGKRKSSIAHVKLTPGNGIFSINGRDYLEYFKRRTDLLKLGQPLRITQSFGQFDIEVKVQGGGTTGQRDAIKLALSKALGKFIPEYGYALSANGMMTVDSRIVERKKYGLVKARRRAQWVKR